jgi:ubiquinone/menaquinone biosynthesis C-methylase UbiE
MTTDWSNSAETYAKAFLKLTSYYSRIGASLVLDDILKNSQDKDTNINYNLKFLDIATGPGTFMIELLKLLPEQYQASEYTLTDFSPAMIAAAQKQLSSHPVDSSKFQFITMNAEELTFPDNSFDYLSCMFGVMFVPDRAKAMREMARVCKAGGTIVLSSWHASEIFDLTVALARYVGSLGPDEVSDTTRTFQICSDPEVFKSELLEAGFQSANVILEEYTFTFMLDHEGMFTAFSNNPGLVQALKGKAITFDTWKEFLLSPVAEKYRREDGSMHFTFVGCVAIATK